MKHLDRFTSSRLSTATRIVVLTALTIPLIISPAIHFSPVAVGHALTLVPHPGIYITSNNGFNQTDSVVSGNGTVSNPYVIEGWEITSDPGISIRYTSVFFIVRNVYLNGFGVDLLYVSNGELSNDTISNSGGVTIESSNSDVVANSTISASVGEGLHIMDSKSISITGNVFSWCRYSAVDLQGYSSSNIVLSSNKIFGNGEDGLDANSSNLTITDNMIYSNGGLGIWLQYDGNINVTGNTILHNGSTGIVLTYLTGTVRAYHNNFVMNGVKPQAYSSLTGSNIWDDGYPDGGNYWSDYAGVDNCSGQMQNICNNPDGIGDTAYTIDLNNRDNYPLIQPWGFRDSQGPSWRTGSSLTTMSISQFGLTLNWTSAMDTYWVANYKVYKDGALIAELAGTTQSYTVNGLLPGTTYFFNVEAGDAWNNWTTNGPSLNVTTVDIPPVPPPQQGAFLFYRLRYSHQANQGEPLFFTNEFWNLGDTPLRIVGVDIQFDFATYSLFSANAQYPTICGGAYSGALNVGLSSGQTLHKSVTVPSTASIGNHTFTATVDWQYQSQMQIYPNSPPITVWCDTGPLSLRGWVQIGPGTTNPNPSPNSTKNPTTPASKASIWSGIRTIFPFALGAWSIIVACALLLFARHEKRNRHGRNP